MEFLELATALVARVKKGQKFYLFLSCTQSSDQGSNIAPISDSLLINIHASRRMTSLCFSDIPNIFHLHNQRGSPNNPYVNGAGFVFINKRDLVYHDGKVSTSSTINMPHLGAINMHPAQALLLNLSLQHISEADLFMWIFKKRGRYDCCQCGMAGESGQNCSNCGHYISSSCCTLDE